MTIRVRAVSEEERKTLGQMARSHTLGAGVVRRAQIVLHALEGLKAPEISARMDLGGKTVRHWLQRFNARGLQGVGRGRAQRTAADLFGRAAQRRDQRRPDPAGGSRPAVRLLDAGPSGRLPEPAGYRHAPQPDQRDLHPRRAEMAARGDLVRHAGRS